MPYKEKNIKPTRTRIPSVRACGDNLNPNTLQELDDNVPMTDEEQIKDIQAQVEDNEEDIDSRG